MLLIFGGADAQKKKHWDQQGQCLCREKIQKDSHNPDHEKETVRNASFAPQFRLNHNNRSDEHYFKHPEILKTQRHKPDIDRDQGDAQAEGFPLHSTFNKNEKQPGNQKCKQEAMEDIYLTDVPEQEHGTDEDLRAVPVAKVFLIGFGMFSDTFQKTGIYVFILIPVVP